MGALAQRDLVWDAGKRVAENAAGEVWDLSSAITDHGTPSLRFARLGGRSEDRRCVQLKVPEPAMLVVQAALAEVRHDRRRASLRAATAPAPVLHTREARVATIAEVSVPDVVSATGHPLLALNADDVRRRRWTWAARLSRLAAPAGTYAVLRPAPPRAEIMSV